MSQEMKSHVSTQTKTKSILGIVPVQYPLAELSSFVIHLLIPIHLEMHPVTYTPSLRNLSPNSKKSKRIVCQKQIFREYNGMYVYTYSGFLCWVSNVTGCEKLRINLDSNPNTASGVKSDRAIDTL